MGVPDGMDRVASGVGVRVGVRVGVSVEVGEGVTVEVAVRVCLEASPLHYIIVSMLIAQLNVLFFFEPF